jgi:hypothetical protein
MNLSFSLQALGKDLSFMPPFVFALGLFVVLRKSLGDCLGCIFVSCLKKIWEKFSLFLPPCSDKIHIVRFCCSGKEEITHT